MNDFKVSQTRTFDSDEHQWNHSNPSKFKRPKFDETHFSSRKYDFSRKGQAVPSRFQDHSLNPSRNQFPKPSHDLSRNCDFTSPQFQNPSLDYSRNESFEEGEILEMNPTRDFLRNSDSISPRSQAIPSRFQDHSFNPSRNQYPKPSHDFSRNCDFTFPRVQNPRFDYSRNKSFREGTALKMDPPRDFLRNGDFVSPGPVSNLVRTDNLTKTCDSIGYRSHIRASENPQEGNVTKANENHFLLRKCDTVSFQPQEKPSENPEDGIVAKANEKHVFSRKFDSVSPRLQERPSTQLQERPSKNHNDGITTEMNLEDDFPRKCEANLTRFQAKNSENQEGQSEKMELTLGSLNKSDALSPQVEPKTSEKSKEGPLQVQAKNSEITIKVSRDNFKRRKLDAVRQFPKHCGALAPRVKVKDCETHEQMKKSEASTPSVVNSDSTKSTISRDNFKKRKVNAVRQFPRHCGALAPRVTIIRCDDNSIVVKEDTFESSKISSSSSAKPYDTNSVEKTSNGINGDDVENAIYESVSSNNTEKCLRDESVNNSNSFGFSSKKKVSLEDSFKRNFEKSDLEEELGKVESESTQPIIDISSESEDEYINDSDLLSNQEKINKSSEYGDSEDSDSSDSEDECYIVNSKYSDLFSNQDKGSNDLKIGPLGDSEAVSKRRQVIETLDSYREILEELFKKKVSKQVELEAAMILKKQKQWLNTDELLGHVPGVEIGDKFRSRAELVCIGLHRLFQGDVDYMKKNGKILATSIVYSHGEFSDIFHYSDQDQKLVRGNLALKNSMEANTPVRVICKSSKSDFTYFYDGLYLVTKLTQEISSSEKLVYTFQLNRIKSLEKKLACLVEKKSR